MNIKKRNVVHQGGSIIPAVSVVRSGIYNISFELKEAVKDFTVKLCNKSFYIILNSLFKL